MSNKSSWSFGRTARVLSFCLGGSFKGRREEREHGAEGRGVRGIEDDQGASFWACAPGGGRNGLTQDGGSQERLSQVMM